MTHHQTTSLSMQGLSLPVRVALTLLVLPFFIGGILLASVVYSSLYESFTGQWRNWLFVLAIGLAIAGILLGALIAYGILIFFLTWLKPNSPLLIESEVDKPNFALRMLSPVFHAVRQFAQSLSPRPRE